MDTGLIAHKGEKLMPPTLPSAGRMTDAAAALVSTTVIKGFRLNADARVSGRFLVGSEQLEIDFAAASESEPFSTDRLLVTEAGQT